MPQNESNGTPTGEPEQQVALPNQLANGPISLTVNMVGDVTMNVIYIPEDRLKWILKDNATKIGEVKIDYFGLIALVVSALFNLASHLRPIVSSEFKEQFQVTKEGWSATFIGIMIISVLWLYVVGKKAYLDYQSQKEQQKNHISVERLLSIIKNEE